MFSADVADIPNADAPDRGGGQVGRADLPSGCAGPVTGDAAAVEGPQGTSDQ